MSSTYLKRIKWRQAYRDSVSEGITLTAKLDAIEALIAQEVEGGKDVASTGTGQRTVSFFRGVEPQDRAQLILDLQDLYALARSYLVARGTANPTDLQIRNEGDSLLVPANEVECDYSELRLNSSPAIGVVVP